MRQKVKGLLMGSCFITAADLMASNHNDHLIIDHSNQLGHCDLILLLLIGSGAGRGSFHLGSLRGLQSLGIWGWGHLERCLTCTAEGWCCLAGQVDCLQMASLCASGFFLGWWLRPKGACSPENQGEAVSPSQVTLEVM